MKIVPVLIVSLFAATPALAERATTEAGKDKLICRSMTPTGSRLGSTRVCMTKQQWADHKQQLREDVERRQTTQTNPQG